MNTKLFRLPRKSVNGGFSLVEVVLATGIMALGVVTILGLLPHGLELSRKTANEQAETRIVDNIVGEFQTINWATINETTQPNRFFDDQGLEIFRNDMGGDEFNMVLNYVAQVTTPPLDVKLPTNSPSAEHQTNRHLRRVIIKLISAPLPEFNFDSPATAIPIKTVTQLVANTGLVPN